LLALSIGNPQAQIRGAHTEYAALFCHSFVQGDLGSEHNLLELQGFAYPSIFSLAICRLLEGRSYGHADSFEID
jgi:hypothetical protein